MLPNNLNLPELPAWQARSFWAQILLMASVMLNTMGIDLMAVTADMGLGGSPDQIIQNGERVVHAWQQLAPLFFGLWAWLERRAPNYRLIWWRGPKLDLVGGLAILALSVSLIFGTASSLRAEGAACQTHAAMTDKLVKRWGEAPVWVGVASVAVLEIYANPKTGTWTLISTNAEGLTCGISAGRHWRAIPQGEPA